jgi:cytochrome P450
MRDEAQSLVGAGLTTTAWALSNACFFIAENKEVQEKLHKELVEAIPDIHTKDAFDFRKARRFAISTWMCQGGYSTIDRDFRKTEPHLENHSAIPGLGYSAWDDYFNESPGHFVQ